MSYNWVRKFITSVFGRSAFLRNREVIDLQALSSLPTGLVRLSEQAEQQRCYIRHRLSSDRVISSVQACYTIAIFPF
jgi:hypothetical protein